MSFVGRWRIVETDLWGEDAIDLLEPARIEFERNRGGRLVVGALQAGLDYRVGTRDGRPIVEFTWLGDDDGHPVSGRGWAELRSGRAIRVELFIHQGDMTIMTGKPLPTRRAAAPPKPAASRRRRSPRR